MKISLPLAFVALMGLSHAAPVQEASEIPASVHHIFARSTCFTDGACVFSDASAIANALIAGGTRTFDLRGQTVVMIQGSCSLWARPANSGTSSYYQDVGYGARFLCNNCNFLKPDTRYVGGSNAAGGNGNFLLQFRQSNAGPPTRW